MGRFRRRTIHAYANENEQNEICAPIARARRAGLPGGALSIFSESVALSAPRPEYPYEAGRARITGSGVVLKTIEEVCTSEGEVPEGCLSEKIIREQSAEKVIFFAPRLKRVRTGTCGGKDAANRTQQRASYSEAARLVRWPSAQPYSETAWTCRT